MTQRRQTGLFTPKPREVVIDDLVQRARARMEGLDDGALDGLLEDALYAERKRLERGGAEEGELERLDALAMSLVRGGRDQRLEYGLSLVRAWSDEVHGRFSKRAYRVATKILPRALTALLSSPPGRNLDPTTRLKIAGDLPLLHDLVRESTVVLAPTHVSNLDSPLIGLGLDLAGLPPFVYGAGLNLFTNPVMGWWMSRLGAYTVDRRKRARLYKDVLKDYSVRSLVTRHHSLFFPGGTRARSGAIETHVKKGLLGTGITAWQEMLRAGRRDAEVYVVPLTLSFQLVLEANTLIEDYLAEAGKQRFIITDDEFTQPRQLLKFANRVLDLDDTITLRFGQPLDVLGNPVAADPSDRVEQAAERRRYVCGRDGQVERDSQRDRVYTDRLADGLVRELPRAATAMSTHVLAWAAWRCLVDEVGSADPFKLLRAPIHKRSFERHVLMSKLRAVLAGVHEGAAAGRWHTDTSTQAEVVLGRGLDLFGRYHRSRAVVARGSQIVMEDPRLCFYYRNRLAYTELDV